MDWNHRWLCRGITLYFVLVILVLALAGCTTTSTVHSGAAPFCTVYSPVYWSSKDTRKTKEQVDANNRVWKKMCKK